MDITTTGRCFGTRLTVSLIESQSMSTNFATIFDVLYDLDRERLITVVDLDNLMIVMTEPGVELARRIDEHKQQGGWMRDFHVEVAR